MTHHAEVISVILINNLWSTPGCSWQWNSLEYIVAAGKVCLYKSFLAFHIWIPVVQFGHGSLWLGVVILKDYVN